MRNPSAQLGECAELVALAYYESEGYRLEGRNFRTPRGEIDLILRRGWELVFVEVKGRARFRPDEAWRLRWRSKIGRIRLVATAYLARSTWDAAEIRLEIVYVTQGRVIARFEEGAFW